LDDKNVGYWPAPPKRRATVDEHAAQIYAAALADAEQPGLAAGRVLSRNQSQPSPRRATCNSGQKNKGKMGMKINVEFDAHKTVKRRRSAPRPFP
jgi:hypothetical protein